MPERTNNKTIAKNTMFLYFRMMVTMVISLYTSRVILQILGVTDYGIYHAVGGIVGFLSFINNALSAGSARFLTYGLGEGDKDKLRRIFSTTLTAHICLASLIVILAETVGLWFLYHKLIIPPDRLEAAVFTFHLSIVTAFFNLTQVPYRASIIAHEKMTIYAYVSIVEAVLKLAIVYMLAFGDIDKLKLYATLFCLLQLGIIIFYRIYCIHHFKETHFQFFIDKKIFHEIAGFSGWSLFANGAIALNSQGILILLNMFFSPAVVAARAISIQVNMHAQQFVSNFQTAANPQIVKLYAAKDYDGSKQLLLQTTRFSYYLMYLLALPIFLGANQLLHIWLGIVPEYTVIFLQLIIIQSLFQVFDTSFYRALYTKGQIRENALISPLTGFIRFPVVYLLFVWGFSPVALSWASLISYMLLGLVIKPILIIRIVDYKWSDVFSVFKPCLYVTLASLPLPLTVYYWLNDHDSMVFSFCVITAVSVLSVACASWHLGMDKPMRQKVAKLVRKKFHNKM